MATAAEFRYDYQDLAALSGLAKNSVYQHTRRGNLDPADLSSVVVWLARHGTLDLRRRMINAALLRELGEDVKPRRKKTRRR